MLYDDSIILIVNIFRVISFDNLIHIIVLRLCFVRTRRDLLDWFIFFSSLCVSGFFLFRLNFLSDFLTLSLKAELLGVLGRFTDSLSIKVYRPEDYIFVLSNVNLSHLYQDRSERQFPLERSHRV